MMNGQPEAPEMPKEPAALSVLRDAKRGILKGSAEMVAARAKVEKYLKNDPALSRRHYEELEKIRRRLLDGLSAAGLALLELEDDAAARLAGKLRTGLEVFNLMSRAYKPVYEALTGFAGKLPEQSDSVNAQVIGRMMNNVRMGYYPTDPENIDNILRGIKFPEGVTTNVFDPCCGCGKALRQIAQGNNCFAFGVELDEYRAEEAQTRLHRVGMGSFFHSRISREAFHLMLLNPPYLSVTSEGGTRTRHEKRFLVESPCHLMFGGLLIYIIPYYRLTPDICRILSDNFSDISVWRFTEKEFKKFKQVAILGLRRKREGDHDTASTLERLAPKPDAIPCITELQENRYVLPTEPKKVDLFKGEKFNVKELERQLCASDSIQRLIYQRSELDSRERRPLLPLSIGQIALVGGSGLINGLIQCDTPHIIKGRIIKVKTEERDEQFSYSGAHMGAEIREVISNKMIFNVLTQDGFKSLT